MPSLRDRLLASLALRYRRWASLRVRESVGAVLGAARATMRRKRYCLLATLGEGGVDARVLQPFSPERDFTVWMGTRRGSRKHEQLRRNPAATLAYQDDARSACVVLVGQADVVEDLAQRRARFKPFWRAFWPEGPEAEDFVLLRFTPRRIEVWDARRRITPAPFGLRSAAVVRGADGAWVRA
jgi:general stress protein 26